MKTFDIKVNEELVNYIERLSFEANAKERIVKTMLGDSSYSNLMENENFLKYQERYEKAFTEYEIAKQEIENMIPENIRKNHQVSWNLNFGTQILSITFQCGCFDNIDNVDDLIRGEK